MLSKEEMIQLRNRKMGEIHRVFNIPQNEFRTFGNDSFIVNITTITGGKLELVINYKGEVIQSVTKNATASSFTIKKSSEKWQTANHSGL